ncbi:hypothetical protein SAMN02745866_01841 [Alteromonadaceae bacterium Bs31]|nr:hypothetical protein SAMN02745866_01841 [Alteromonadaceae bacterium Bs31]
MNKRRCADLPGGNLAQQRLEAEWPLIEQLWWAMREALRPLGLLNHVPAELKYFDLLYIKSDPFDASESLFGEWRENNSLLGSVVIHENGNAFAELDILIPHPLKKAWFIEAVTAWGTRENIKAELRLLPSL